MTPSPGKTSFLMMALASVTMLSTICTYSSSRASTYMAREAFNSSMNTGVTKDEYWPPCIKQTGVVIKSGDNAEAKKMAEKTIKEQGQEIAEMKEWLRKNARKEGNR